MPTIITTNSDGQPRADISYGRDLVRVEIDGFVRLLSANMAEEFAVSLHHAAATLRQRPTGLDDED